jgi:hypothetical protein
MYPPPKCIFAILHTGKQLWRMQRIFIQCMQILSTPYSTVLTINLSTQVELHFVDRKTNVLMSFLWKENRVIDYRITMQYSPTVPNQGTEPGLTDSVNAGNVYFIVWGGGWSYILASVFRYMIIALRASVYVCVCVLVHSTSPCYIHRSSLLNALSTHACLIPEFRAKSTAYNAIPKCGNYSNIRTVFVQTLTT